MIRASETATATFDKGVGMINGHSVGTVYIRGLAFKARHGGRRQMVLLQLKKLDEGDTDLWLLKYAVVAALAFSVGGWVGSTWPILA